MKFFSIQYILTTLEVIQLCNGARILTIYLLPVRSHLILINELIKELAHKGHHIDIISMHPPMKERIPNYKQILKLPNPFPEMNNTIAFMKDFNQNPEQLFIIGNMLCENIFKNPEFMKIIKNPSKERPYDMIILHALNTNCFIIAGHIWKIPVVVVSTSSLYPWMHDMVGNPENIAFSSNNMLSALEDHSFYSRFVNFYYFYQLKFNYLYYALDQDRILKKYFGSNAPTLKELDQSVSLMLVNTYFSMNGAKPKATSVIEIGGLHIRNEDPTLNNSLDKWLDESKDGFIYFTLGSIFRIEKLPPETLDAIFKTLEKMAPTRILVKMMTPEDLPFKLPQNFKSLEWIPQEKVLQHPNIKVFITHGGLLGTQESIYYGVPMLCIPFFADQSTNAYNYVRQNIATMVDILSLSEENFEHAVNEVLNNPIYRDNVKALSKLFRDRPQSAMDTAIFWVEYVLRNGKDSLRSTAMDLKWWQIALLDIYAVIILGFLIFLFILKLFVKMIWKLVYFRKNNTVPKEKKRN